MISDPRDQRIAELEAAVAERDLRIAALEQTVTLLLARIQDLEDRLGRNSGNSSTPPSADPPWAPRPSSKKPSGKKAGGQPGHPGHHRKLATPDVVRDHWPERCRCCQSPFVGSEPEAGDPIRHQVTEIPPIKPVVTEHRLHRLRCACGKSTRAAHPAGVPTGHFGTRLIALAALLGGRYRITRREMVALFQDGFGVTISLGTAQALCEHAARALEKPFEEVAREVLSQDVAHADETGHRHRGRRNWLWMVGNRRGAVFKFQTGRGHEARRTLLPDDYPGVVVSDRWHVYDVFKRRGLCHAHLLRNWKAISERKSVEAKAVGTWGESETRRLLRLNRKLRSGELSPAEFARGLKMVKARYSRLLNRAADSGDKKAIAMAKDLDQKWEFLWTFATEPGVEPTNNEGERDLRPAVLWRKGSFGTWSENGKRFRERVLTVAATARKLGRHLFQFLNSSTEAMVNRLPAPSIYATP